MPTNIAPLLAAAEPPTAFDAFIVLLFVLLAMSVPFLLIRQTDKNNRRRVKQHQEERRAAQLAYNQEIMAIIDRQRTEQPVVTVPVTHCERRERRRRLLPIEDNHDATR
jgi:inner membrane protein involved in colicin E2 resistance